LFTHAGNKGDEKMKRIISGFFILFFITATGYSQESNSLQMTTNSCADKADSVKIGMTRADVEKLFHQDGGIMGIFKDERYVLKDCNCQGHKSIKVNVSFKPFGTSDKENSKDVITKISEPYCDYWIAD
jgi:hypothetical protein